MNERLSADKISYQLKGLISDKNQTVIKNKQQRGSQEYHVNGFLLM